MRDLFRDEVVCVEMDGGAVAPVCTRFGVPFLILRVERVQRNSQAGHNDDRCAPRRSGTLPRHAQRALCPCAPHSHSSAAPARAVHPAGASTVATAKAGGVVGALLIGVICFHRFSRDRRKSGRLPSKRKPPHSFRKPVVFFVLDGGEYWTRTSDPLHVNSGGNHRYCFVLSDIWRIGMTFV